mgnify:CR=1 FL=1
MNTDEKLKSILYEEDEIAELLEASGDMGRHFAASLFRLALSDKRPIPTACESAAETYIQIMKDISRV